MCSGRKPNLQCVSSGGSRVRWTSTGLAVGGVAAGWALADGGVEEGEVFGGAEFEAGFYGGAFEIEQAAQGFMDVFGADDCAVGFVYLQGVGVDAEGIVAFVCVANLTIPPMAHFSASP